MPRRSTRTASEPASASTRLRTETIYQPEVAAGAIVHATRHDRREWYVGWPTVKAIVGNKLFPGYGNYCLARHGNESRQRHSPTDPDRTNNLDGPVDDSQDHGAHGDFDSESRSFSWQLWASQNRGMLALGGMVSLLVGWGLCRNAKLQSSR